MSYASLGAATVLAPAEQARVQAAIALMPRCYTQEFHDCVNRKASDFPNCAELEKLWGPDDKSAVSNALDAYIDQNIPFCHSSDLVRSKTGYAIVAGAALAGLALGYLLGSK